MFQHSWDAIIKELYLYSPFGLYSLYRASVPVQWCTLTFFFSLSYSSV